MESNSKAIHAPTIAPALLGTQPRNQTDPVPVINWISVDQAHSPVSPGVKWAYGSMLPTERSIGTSMDMTMPLDSAMMGVMNEHSARIDQTVMIMVLCRRRQRSAEENILPKMVITTQAN